MQQLEAQARQQQQPDEDQEQLEEEHEEGEEREDTSARGGGPSLKARDRAGKGVVKRTTKKSRPLFALSIRRAAIPALSSCCFTRLSDKTNLGPFDYRDMKVTSKLGLIAVGLLPPNTKLIAKPLKPYQSAITDAKEATLARLRSEDTATADAVEEVVAFGETTWMSWLDSSSSRPLTSIPVVAIASLDDQRTAALREVKTISVDVNSRRKHQHALFPSLLRRTDANTKASALSHPTLVPVNINRLGRGSTGGTLAAIISSTSTSRKEQHQQIINERVWRKLHQNQLFPTPGLQSNEEKAALGYSSSSYPTALRTSKTEMKAFNRKNEAPKLPSTSLSLLQFRHLPPFNVTTINSFLPLEHTLLIPDIESAAFVSIAQSRFSLKTSPLPAHTSC